MARGIGLIYGKYSDNRAGPAVEKPVNRYQRESTGKPLGPNVYYNFRTPNAGLAGSGSYGKPLYGGLNYRYGEDFDAQTNDPREWLAGGRMRPGRATPWGNEYDMSKEEARRRLAVMDARPLYRRFGPKMTAARRGGML